MKEVEEPLWQPGSPLPKLVWGEGLSWQGYEVIRIDGYQMTQDRASVRKRIEAAVDEPVEEA